MRKITAIISFATILLLLLSGLPSTARAATGTWQTDEMVQARLIADTDTISSTDKQITVGIEILLDRGWHTYWRSPGDAGVPPRINWSASQTVTGNVEDTHLLYPAPHRYSVMGMETIGYSNRVVFPVVVKLREAGRPVYLDTTIELLVCGNLCLPKKLQLTLNMPAGNTTSSVVHKNVTSAMATVPARDGESARLSVTDIVRANDSLQVTISSQSTLQSADIFVEGAASLVYTKPEVTIAEDRLSATLKSALAAPAKGVDPTTAPLVITVVANTSNGTIAVEKNLGMPDFVPTLTAQNAVPQQASEQPSATLMFMLLLAIIGGFILNLMPCVLPVLSLKILAAVRHEVGDRKAIRRSFLTTAAGIISSFLILAAVTVLLREAGYAVGWGIQFQQPIFLVFLILLLVMFASNLWGLFTISLPSVLATRLGSHHRAGLTGDFATGAFATLLATPCSAPFLGTAVGWAMTAGMAQVFAVFAALGLGMALPWLIIAAAPRLHTLLPRPGKWMLTLRHILGWALALTALWLVWVLAMETSVATATAIAACMAVVVLTMILRHRRRDPQARRIMLLVMIAAALTPFALTIGDVTPAPDKSIIGTTHWQTFREDEISALVASGKTVFVNVTADWCLTCKLNEHVALQDADVVQALFANANVIAMQADWTRQDGQIMAFLTRHGRYGVPFNAVFSPSNPHGTILPELLTKQIVLDGLRIK